MTACCHAARTRPVQNLGDVSAGDGKHVSAQAGERDGVEEAQIMHRTKQDPQDPQDKRQDKRQDMQLSHG